MHASMGHSKLIDTRDVKQIYKERFKTANPLYIYLANPPRTAYVQKLSQAKLS
jgi:hypothetical protein